MAVDYRINLAKNLTSSPEARARFYNGMLVYLVTCSALLVVVAYLSSVSLKHYMQNNQERLQLIRTATLVSGLDATAFNRPEETYAELEIYSHRMASLKTVLGQRVQLLPVMHNLFLELPDGVALQSLSADKSKLVFGLVMPPPSEEAGDPVRDLRAAWEKNEELMKRVSSIRPLTGERRTMGSKSVFYVQFECVLNK